MPNTAKGGGISRKIFNYEERNKIRKILNEIDIPKNMGLIVRTAGSGKSKNEINNDLQGTTKIWEEINFKDCVLEEKIKFDREISILYARSLDGSQCFFPISENHHENGILRKTIAPINLNKKLKNELLNKPTI